MRTFPRSLVLALVAVVLLGTLPANAALPPVGQVNTCPCRSLPDIIIFGLPPINNTLFNGSITARVTAASPTQDTLQVLGFNSRGFNSTVGNVTIALDPTRPSPPSSLVSNQTSASYPATQTMRLHVTVTVDALGGETFQSVQPVVFVNPQVPFFPPPSGTVYRLAAPVDLVSASDPTGLVGRINAATVTITGSQVTN